MFLLIIKYLHSPYNTDLIHLADVENVEIFYLEFWGKTMTTHLDIKCRTKR